MKTVLLQAPVDAVHHNKHDKKSVAPSGPVLQVLAPPLVSQPLAPLSTARPAYACALHARWGAFFEELRISFAYATTTIEGLAIPFFVLVPQVVGGNHVGMIGMEMLVRAAPEDLDASAQESTMEEDAERLARLGRYVMLCTGAPASAAVQRWNPCGPMCKVGERWLVDASGKALLDLPRSSRDPRAAHAALLRAYARSSRNPPS